MFKNISPHLIDTAAALNSADARNPSPIPNQARTYDQPRVKEVADWSSSGQERTKPIFWETEKKS